ncbi:hypothetical protein Tco_0878745 [Tanacetum coccineum]|uniref:Uncharacterized protein n=1 Tax=Tanacetum coccineum TaxID=301880 RepID=A0ABQ5C444_9ASTR
MDPNSSLGKIFLGEDVVVISSDKVKGSRDWNSLEFQDTANSGQKKAMVFYQMDTEEVSDRFVAPCFVNRLEAYDGEINLGVEENMTSNEYEDDMKKVDRGITMINHTQAEAMGILTNVLCQVGVTTLIAKFLILDIPIDRNSPIVVGRGFLRTIGSIVNTPERLFSTFDGFCHQTFCAARSDFIRNVESDSDDEEDYQIKRNKFGAPIYGPKPAPAIIGYTNLNWKPDYKGSYIKEEATGQWRTEIRLTDPYRNIYLQGFKTKKMDRKLSKYHKLSDIMSPNLWEQTMTKPSHHDPNAQDKKSWKRMGCDGEIDDILRIRLREAGSDEEIFTLVAWIRAFNINEPLYAKLCHEFYSTYEFDEVCANDELGLYQAVELEEEGFNVYFEGGLRNDDNFNAQDYWLSISREDNLGLSRSHTSTIRNPILRVIYKMITYGLCQRTNGVLIEDVVRSLSASIYCRDLDTTTLRDLIDSDGKLILEDPQPGVPRVGIPRPLRASMQDLYDRMGRMEIRQEAIERMEYRQSYH